jgi:hypothetical protein
MAGGGIIAFNGEDEEGSEVPEPKRKYQQYTLQEQGADWEAQRQAARDAAENPDATSMAGDVYRAVSKPVKGLADLISSAWKNAGERQKLTQQFNKEMPGFFEELTPEQRKEREAKLAQMAKQIQQVGNTPADAAEATPPGINPLTGKPISRAAMEQGVAPMIPQATRARTDVPPRPQNAPGSTRVTAAQPAKQDGLDAALEKQIMGDLGLDREAERDKGADYFKKTVGLDSLLQEMEKRNQDREARIAENKANRTPEWIKGLQAVGGAPIRGGIGMVLGQLGRGTTAAREAYGDEDMKYADEMDKLRDVITKAKIEGNTAVANAGMAALKETDAARRAAMTSGTSLQSNRNSVAQRLQTSADALAARMQSERHRQEDRAAARAGGADKQQLNELKALQTNLKDQLKEPALMGKAGDFLRAQLARVNTAIAQMAGLDTMSSAPGASSPGGTRPPLSSFQR